MSMTRCDHIQDRLSRWLDDELTASEASEVAAHVDRCAACAAEVEAWSRIDAVLSAPIEGPDLAPAVLAAIAEDHIPVAWWLRIAAAAVLAVGLGLSVGGALEPAEVASRDGAPLLGDLERHFGQPAPAGFADLITDLTSPSEG